MELTLDYSLGKPVAAGKTRVFPITKAFRLVAPGRRAGLVWNRPSAVLVRTPDGTEQILQIRDITRETQLTLLGVALVVSIFIWLARRRYQPE